MSSIAAKQKRHQEHKAKQKEGAKRKAKSYKRLVLARRRQVDLHDAPDSGESSGNTHNVDGVSSRSA
jgi:hypothetical protein